MTIRSRNLEKFVMKILKPLLLMKTVPWFLKKLGKLETKEMNWKILAWPSFYAITKK
jgi:hypothetical protein